MTRTALAVVLGLMLLESPRGSAQTQFNCTTNSGAITINGAVLSGGDLTIPEQIAGLPVTAIVSSAFAANPSLRCVRLASSVASIGVNAFGGCTNLSRVTIDHTTAARFESGAVPIEDRPYTVTAVTYSNFLFSGWAASVDDGPLVVVATTPTFSFTLQHKLKLFAQFVPNRFLAAAGTYNGLFWDTKRGVALDSAGFASIKVTASEGKPPTFSASLSFGGETVGCSGAFDVAGNGVAARPIWLRQDPDTSYVLSLTLPPDGPMTGVLRRVDGSWSAELSADKAVPISTYAGQYTMILPGAKDPAVGPGGDGYALVNVTTNGLLKVTGALGDGTAFSQKVPVSANGDWPLFAAVNPTTAANNARMRGGMLFGWLRLNPAPDGTLYHLKAAGVGSRYLDGFTNEFTALASPYADPTLSGGRVLEFADGRNGLVTLSGRGLSMPVSLLPLNKFAGSTMVVDGVTNKLTFAVTLKTGKLMGALTTNGVAAATLQGAVLQNMNLGRGYFLTPTSSEAFRLESQ